MTLGEIRKKYLDFFEGKGHVVVPSASLLPENDPTTLFTGSGMQPMVPYLLGESHPLGTRITDSQKCFRAQDIEEVGDNRHGTFFEMLGNWSLGDYFKKEQISWMFEFLIDAEKGLGLNPQNLYITVFRGNDEFGIPRDKEAVSLWKEQFSSVGIEADDVDFSERDGMQGGRIFYYDESKNWWSRVGVPTNMPEGEPGGPDTEMFWDFGEELGLHEKSEFKDDVCHVNCDCGRFVEIGNNVFMEFIKTADGFSPLPQKNVDFGGGLERMAMAKNNESDAFALDVFVLVKEELEKLSGLAYSDETARPFRIVMDHLRSATFLIADGAVPSNKDQGYFTRRLIRRAVRFAHSMNITEHVCVRIIAMFIDTYKDAYPALLKKKESILNEAQKEEEKFLRTLDRGLREFEKLSDVTGKDAFNLFATYGFPLELTEELAEERGLQIDKEQFEEEFKKHQELSRQGGEKRFKGGLADHSEMSTKYHTATHLLHQALRDVLGEHAEQKGSNITAERLRFDFTHPEKMTSEQIAEVEKIVNEQIQADLPVSFEEMSVDEAKERGAIGLFEDKYADKVKVYKMGEYSMEICGGPHVERTGDLGTFKIKKEQSSSSGVRRIKAVLK